jgi:hypothetical protein
MNLHCNPSRHGADTPSGKGVERLESTAQGDPSTWRTPGAPPD